MSQYSGSITVKFGNKGRNYRVSGNSPACIDECVCLVFSK